MLPHPSLTPLPQADLFTVPLGAMHAANFVLCTLCPHPFSLVSRFNPPIPPVPGQGRPRPTDLPRPQCPSLHLFCIAVPLQVCPPGASASLKPSEALVWTSRDTPAGTICWGMHQDGIAAHHWKAKGHQTAIRQLLQGRLRSVWSSTWAPFSFTTIQQHPSHDSHFTHEKTEILRRPKEKQRGLWFGSKSASTFFFGKTKWSESPLLHLCGERGGNGRMEFSLGQPKSSISCLRGKHS